MSERQKAQTGATDAPNLSPHIAPVDTGAPREDPLTHSLTVLSSIYHYNHWIFDSIRDHLGPAVLEVGAGVGNITQFLLNVEKLVCLEPFEPYHRHLSSRFREHLNVRVIRAMIEACPTDDVPANGFDTVVCLNVLEHIRDDEGVLRRLATLLKPGGRAVILVPALPLLYGRMDAAMGHVRRYTRTELNRKLLAARLTPCQVHYMNGVGAAGWWWRGRVLRKETIPEQQTRTFDRLVPLLSAMERLLPPLLGQSLVAVGRKE